MSKSLRGIYALEDIHDYRIDRHTFTIHVGGEATTIHSADPESYEPGVEHNMASRFERNLSILSGIDEKRPILVRLESCGGLWPEGMQMFSAILYCPNPVTILATRWARSMTSIIPLAADKFILRPPARYMFHQGTFGFSGTVQEAVTEFQELVKDNEVMFRIYTERLKEQGKFKRWSRERIREMLEKRTRQKMDVWLDADEAERWGFVDEVLVAGHAFERAASHNEERRQALINVLRTPINVEIAIS